VARDGSQGAAVILASKGDSGHPALRKLFSKRPKPGAGPQLHCLVDGLAEVFKLSRVDGGFNELALRLTLPSQSVMRTLARSSVAGRRAWRPAGASAPAAAAVATVPLPATAALPARSSRPTASWPAFSTSICKSYFTLTRHLSFCFRNAEDDPVTEDDLLVESSVEESDEDEVDEEDSEEEDNRAAAMVLDDFDDE
jgi:hypothetical protein